MPKKRTPGPVRGRSDLVQAVKNGDVDRGTAIIDSVKGRLRTELLAQGLTVSCEQKQYGVVQRLTSLGADPSKAFATKLAPLVLAVGLDDTELVKHLLEHDNYHKDDSLRESFRRSCIIAAKSREVALLILDKGFDIHGASGKEGKTLLMDVRTPEVVDTLIDKGARLEDTDDQGRTALMLATTAEMVKLLIDRGAKLEAKDQQGRTALMAALEYDEESEPIARVLIERGANIEARDKEGRSILTTAIWKGRLALLKLLINNGVNVSAIDDRGRNAFHHLTSDKRRNYEYRPHRQSGRKQTQQDRDQEIIDILLRSKVDPSATDRHDRTCIHWAAGNGNSGLLKLLLKTGKFNINAVERRRKTPLHLAAASSCIIDKPILGKDGKVKNPSPNGHFHTMLVLLDHGASVTAQSDGDWTPLHNACWNNADSRETVGVLLRHVHGAERHSKNRNGRTPLHIAAHAGNLRVVDYLLKRRDVKRHERDIFGNTPLLYAASLPQKSPEDRKKRDAVMDLLASWNNAGVLSSEAREASKLFQATIVDFEASDKGSTPRPGGHAPKKVSVFDLLYNPRVGNQHVSTQANDGSENFRWIHLPANNVSWCLDLIADYFISNRASDVSSFKALERSFNHQHRGSRRHSHYMTPLCQTVIRSGHGDQRTLATEIELQRGMSQESTLTDEHSESPFRPDSMQGILGIDSNILTNSPRLLAKDGIHQPPVSLEPRREVKPKSSTEEVSISDAYLFMPYIYYETQEHRDKMVCTYEGWQEVQDCNPKIAGTAHIHAIQKNTNQRDLSSPTTDKHDLLFRAHCKTPETPLHIRRTLDQFFYHNIDTSERDKDQVLHRYQGVVQKIEPHLHKVLMVDQLWMWVLGKDLVVTSFPPRWTPPLKDSLDIHENILAIINSGGRERIRNVYELAMIIVGRCYGAYDRHGIGSEELQFLDIYESWIGSVMDDEVLLFDQFKEDSGNASEWLRNPRNLRDIKREQKKSDRSRQGKTGQKARPKRTFSVLSSREDIDMHRQDFVENLLDIGSETALLKEVKDIQDELHMLLLVFQHQLQVLPSMESAMREIWTQERWSTAAKRRIEKAFDDHRRTIVYPRTDVERMEKQTHRIYKSITDLLDLKQKHANAIEARYAREQTEATSRQGQTFLVFTTVTVIFLPLSFIAALFAIDIRELPHTGDSQVLSIAFVSKYTFGIGLSVAALCVLTAIYAEDVAYHFRETVKKAFTELRHTTTEAERIARTKWQQQQQDPEKAGQNSASEKGTLYENLYQPVKRKEGSLAFRRKSQRDRDLEFGKVL